MWCNWPEVPQLRRSRMERNCRCSDPKSSCLNQYLMITFHGILVQTLWPESTKCHSLKCTRKKEMDLWDDIDKNVCGSIYWEKGVHFLVNSDSSLQLFCTDLFPLLKTDSVSFLHIHFLIETVLKFLFLLSKKDLDQHWNLLVRNANSWRKTLDSWNKLIKCLLLAPSTEVRAWSCCKMTASILTMSDRGSLERQVPQKWDGVDKDSFLGHTFVEKGSWKRNIIFCCQNWLRLDTFFYKVLSKLGLVLIVH